MTKVFAFAAVGCAVFGVESKNFKWSDDKRARGWSPAHGTIGVMPLFAVNPSPTRGPDLAQAAQVKRTTEENTCAYIEGDPDAPLFCGTDSACIYNNLNSMIGCCPDTSTICAFYTTCYDRTDSDSYTTDNGYTLWCGSSAHPYCKTHLYKDAVFTGFTLLDCDVAAGTDSVLFDATVTSSTVGNSRTVTTSSRSMSTTETEPAMSTSATASPASTSSAPSQASSPPVGAIVGGVIGGLAVISLAILGAFFLLRRRRPSNNSLPPAAPATSQGFNHGGSYPSQPSMQQYAPPQRQQQSYAALPPSGATYIPQPQHLDNRASIQKPAFPITQSLYEPSLGSSPPGSPPPPQSHSPMPAYQAANQTVTAAPAAVGRANDANAASSPTSGVPVSAHGAQSRLSTQEFPNAPAPAYQQFVAPQFQNGGYAYEMPVTRSDGELRELA